MDKSDEKNCMDTKISNQNLNTIPSESTIVYNGSIQW